MNFLFDNGCFLGLICLWSIALTSFVFTEYDFSIFWVVTVCLVVTSLMFDVVAAVCKLASMWFSSKSSSKNSFTPNDILVLEIDGKLLRLGTMSSNIVLEYPNSGSCINTALSSLARCVEKGDRNALVIVIVFIFM